MKPLRVLFTADLHMSNRLPLSKPVDNGLTDRFRDQLNVFGEIFDIAKKNHVDAIFILGDLFDKALVDPVTLTHTMQILVKNDDKLIYILPGNHDASSVKGGRYIVEVCTAIDKDHIHVIHDEPFVLDGIGVGVRFWPMAFKSIGQNIEDLQGIRERDEASISGAANYDVLLMHNSIIGAKHLNWVCDNGLDSDALCLGFDRVYSGHFHDHQKFGKNGMYVGAPMHHHFGDVGRAATCVVTEFKEDKISDKIVNVGGPRFHAFNNIDKNNLDDSVRSGDYVRLNIEATQADWVGLKPGIEALFDEWSDLGLNLSYVHKPIYHHESRIDNLDFDSGDITLDHAVSNYVDSVNLVDFDLDSAKLKEIGFELLGIAKQNKV
jgi:DNA repair exonuclease SbcCD nuclease subunit